MSAYRHTFDDGTELYVVEDSVGFMVVHVTENDDEQVSPVYDNRLQAEHYMWRIIQRGAV